MFYTYLWLREDGTPYYVGKGKGNRAYEKHRVKTPPKERVIVQEFECEDDAFFAEKFLIALYGRKDNVTGCLSNLTDGGEGQSGAQFSEEWRNKIAKAITGKPCPGRGRSYKKSEEFKKKISNTLQGHGFSTETLQKMRLAKLGKSQANHKPPTTNPSGYKGVYLVKGLTMNPWRATITTAGKRTQLGYFSKADDAARAYNIEAYRRSGEFAYLNAIPKGDSCHSSEK